MGKIVGVRYVGKKPQAEDTVLESGAIWKPGQVHNFAEKLAARLLVHTDSFEEVPVSANGDTFMSGKIDGQVHYEPAAYINLNAMSVEQMVHYARREHNRTLDTESKSEDQLREEVQTMMRLATLDELDENKVEDTGPSISIPVSQDELDALNDGTLIAKIIPAEVIFSSALSPAFAKLIVVQHDITQILDSEEDFAMLSENAPELRDAYVALRDIAKEYVEPVEFSGDVEHADGNTGNVGDEKENPINSMDKKDLLAFATEKGIKVNDKAPVATLRKQLIKATSEVEE